jgi:CHAT domain-containing protein
MIFRSLVFRFVILCIFVGAGSLHFSFSLGIGKKVTSLLLNPTDTYSSSETVGNSNNEMVALNGSLLNALTNNDMLKAKSIVEKLVIKIAGNKFDEGILSESYYLIGVYYLKEESYFESAHYLTQCIALKEKNHETDNRYFKALYNLSLVSFALGDLNRFENYAAKSLETGQQIFGDSNPDLALSYFSLLTAYIELNEYEKALTNSDNAISIINHNPDKVSPSIQEGIYVNIGVCYTRLGNFSKAKIYYEKAESIYTDFRLSHDERYINLLDGLASTYSSLGLTELADNYYTKGVSLAISSNSQYAFNIINNYCIYLAKNKNAANGENILRDALGRAKVLYEKNPHDYFEVLYFYANYLRDNKIDNKKAISSYDQCFQYFKENKQDISLNYSVSVGYSRALKEAGEPEKALELIQSLLFPDRRNKIAGEFLDNPSIDTLKPDINSLKILKLKYSLLWDIYKKNGDQRTLEAASNTSELIVALLDRLRINISEEESRLILGDRFRDSYLNAIRDFNILYNQTANPRYLKKAFEYSEKTKVAGLLASTRELKATQFHIPLNTSNFEMSLRKEISLFNARISDELLKKKPNEQLIASWKEGLLETTRKRDSLVRVFEKQYPDYYAIKYNTQMIGLNEIPELVGKYGNYINYVVSDTMLYTFVVNRTNQKLFAIHIDSSFFNDIKHFRGLLSMPSPSDNAAQKFKEYQSVGHSLYKVLFEPIKSYLISDILYISPDNILSYLPFETIPSTSVSQEAINYRDLSYLMNSYDISYAYSATFLAEYINKELEKSNKLIAFAPNYPEPIDIQKALMSRQSVYGVLNDLPYAREEAEYITRLTGGKLFENNDARESVYKNESGKYDIIHLSMHTLINDKDPMRSTLIFSHLNDTTEDGYLKTYEIYGIPLKAKMVVLSSCNTGSGLLFSGEGILSLARGFIYSGSQSVVMSMWEIEDKSGTEIVEKFYQNLKKGYSKSASLKKARIDFLKNADQLRSHPYFWATLVIYGNNDPLFYSNKLKVSLTVIGVILILSIIYYFSKRKYS